MDPASRSFTDEAKVASLVTTFSSKADLSCIGFCLVLGIGFCLGLCLCLGLLYVHSVGTQCRDGLVPSHRLPPLMKSVAWSRSGIGRSGPFRESLAGVAPAGSLHAFSRGSHP